MQKEVHKLRKIPSPIKGIGLVKKKLKLDRNLPEGKRGGEEVWDIPWGKGWCREGEPQ